MTEPKSWSEKLAMQVRRKILFRLLTIELPFPEGRLTALISVKGK
jgi:hypothetical protein